jgi:GWxTD domain-containing protein
MRRFYKVFLLVMPLLWTAACRAPVNIEKVEFEKRIEYANRWFGWRNPDKGRLKSEEQEKYRGWDTERGRVYIVLGPPESLIYDGSALMNEGCRISSPEGKRVEVWGYWWYRLYGTFSRGGMGRWVVSDPEPDLFYFLDQDIIGLPYDPQQKGDFLLDIIVEDKLAVAFPKYRTYVRFRK